ncbi:MAG: hypothetical protein K2G52_00660 [Muribaculaceae bacterium]|nr:hypothetical protein [Muribaculaceae bacterium]
MKTFDDTNRSGNPQPPIPEDPLNENISVKDEATIFDNGPESPGERLSSGAVKGSAWLLGIVGVFAVAILVAWLVGMHDSPLSSRSDARQAAALSAVGTPLDPSLSMRSAQTPTQFVAILIPSGGTGVSQNVGKKSSDVSGDAASSVNASSSVAVTAGTSSSSSSSSASAADEDRIEKEAREVIQGDFGDNPERKLKLGGDYAAVQERVNEILHHKG